MFLVLQTQIWAQLVDIHVVRAHCRADRAPLRLIVVSGAGWRPQGCP
jgi:hypothetical protein